MMNKLNVLLVEDDRATNFLNKHIIEREGFTESIHVSEDGQKALEFLKRGIKNNHLFPDLIFLDINMPILNGWGFLEAYKELEFNQKKKIIIIILSSSVNPDDKQKAESIKDVSGFINKPLSPVKISNIVRDFFMPN